MASAFSPSTSRAAIYCPEGEKTPQAFSDRLRSVEGGELGKLVGRQVKAIPTPGHSKGHRSYLVDGSILFTGDAIRLQDGKAEEFNPFFIQNRVLARVCMDGLSGLQGVEGIYTAPHGYAADCGKVFSAGKMMLQ